MKTGKPTTGKYAGLKELDIQILKALKDNPEGLRAKTLCQIIKVPERTNYNHLQKLKKKELIKNIYPIWKLGKLQESSPKLANLLRSDKVQAHKIHFVLQLLKKPDWWEKRRNRMMRLKKYHFRPVGWGNNRYEMLTKDSFLVQFFANTIIFINQQEYYGNDAYDCFIEAVQDALELVRFIEDLFRYKFYPEGVPSFYVRSQHYVKLRDEIAMRCRKEGNRLKVEIEGKLRAWVDLSEPFGLETGDKDYAVEDSRRYASFVSDIIDKNPSLPSEVDARIDKLIYGMHGIQQNQGVFDANMKSHIKAIQDISKATNELIEAVKDLSRRINGK